MNIKDCFVIMPFSKTKTHNEQEWTDIYEDLFKAAWESFDIKCYRVEVLRGSITKNIIESLYSASVVFADLTDSNPNVLYELGVRHALGKPSVMVKQAKSKIPFDVNDYTVFKYTNTPTGLKNLKKHIKTVIEDIELYPNRSDNPVWDFLHTSDFIESYYKTEEAIGKLEALGNEFNSNLELYNSILMKLKDAKLEQKKKVGADTTTILPVSGKIDKIKLALLNFFASVQSNALVHLIITRYINFNQEQWDIMRKVQESYTWMPTVGSNMASLSIKPSIVNSISNIRKDLEDALLIVDTRIKQLKSTTNK